MEAEQARSDTLDAQRRAMNDEDAIAYGPEWYKQTQANDALSVQDVMADVDAGWNEGLADGEQNLKDVAAGVRRVGGDVLSFPISLIPWQAWLVLALLVFWWMGGAQMLKGKLAK